MRTLAIDRERTAGEHVSSFLSGAAFSTSGMAVSGVITMLTGVIFARWLKPEGFGIYSSVVAVVTVGGGLGAVGMDFTVARYVCYYLGTGDRHLIRTVIRYAVRWGLLFSAVVGATFFVLLHGGLLDHTKLAGLVPFSTFLLLAIPAIALQNVLLQSILALQAVKTRVFLEKILHPLMRLIAPFTLLWFFREKTTAAVGGILFGALVLTAIALLVLRTRLQGLPRAVAAPADIRREWSAFAIPYVFVSIQSFVSAGMGIDIILVGALASMSDSGIYAACFRFTLVLLLARAGMDYAFGPRVGRLYGKSDFESIERLYKTTSVVGLAWTLPFAVVLIIFSQQLMGTFFGPGYVRGGAALALLVVGFAADGAAGCNITLLTMIGKPWLVMINGLAGGVLTVGLCLSLIPRYGMVGAAVAVSVARCAATAMGTFEIWRIHGLHPFSRSLWKLALAALVAALLGCFCKHQVQVATHSLVTLTAAVCLAFFGYLASLRVFRFSLQSY